MARENRPRIEIDRENETRTEEISKMIGEGGLGTRTTHYEIVKNGSLEKAYLSESGVALNKLVANLGVFYVKLHQYHWYVTGSSCCTLLEKFEELYNTASDNFDAFAERMIAKGEAPYSTLSGFLEHSEIAEKAYTDPLSSVEVVEDIMNDYETIKRIAHEGAEAAANENDVVTEDMLIGYVEEIDLTIWMLRAYLGQ